jgi:hypothetical protein
MVGALDSIPYEPHRRAVAEMLREAAAQPPMIGALLIGSLGRGRALPGSDVDLLFLVREGHGAERPFYNHERHGVAVEFHFRDLPGARAQLAAEPTWLYAYLDSRILHDPTGTLAELCALARERFAAYRAEPTLKHRYAFMVDRTRHKLRAAVEANDPLRAGGIASTYAQVIINGLWTAHDRPHLGVSELWAHLHDLDDLPIALSQALERLFLGAALDRAHAGIALCEWIVERLGSPVLDPYQIAIPDST